MKTKIILLLCLLVGSAFSQVSAQDKSNNAIQGWTTSTYWSPVYCDGVEIDLLEGGELRVHYVYRYKNGKFFKEVDQLKGEVTSKTGEVFKIRETDKTYFTDHWYVSWHYNLIGDQGNHYTGWITYSYWDGSITIGHTTCN